MDYLARIGQTFYARIPIPKDLQDRYNRKEIKHSLHTKKKTSARSVLLKLLVQYQQEFLEMRCNTMSSQQKPPTKRAIEIWLQVHPGKDWTKPPSRMEIFATNLTFTPIEHIQLLLDSGYEPDENGIFDTTKPPQHEPVHYQQMQPVQHTEPQYAVPAPVVQPKPNPKKLMTIGKAVALYLDVMEHGDPPKISAKTIGYVKSTASRLQQFLDYVGESTPLDKAGEKLEAFTVHVLSVSNFKISSSNAYGASILIFYKWCILKGYTTTLPTFKTAQTTKAQRANKGNRPFTDNEVQTILDALVVIPASNRKQRKRNVSFIYFCLTLLFSGFRRGEAIGLTTADFKTREGIDFLDLPADRIAEFKTETSPRILPMHKIFKSLGILKYISVNTEPKPFYMSYSVYRVMMNTILYATGIKTERGECLFHSFRHGFDSVLNATGGLEDSHRKMLTGHKIPGIDNIYLHLLNQHIVPFNAGVQKMPYAKMFDFTKLNEHLRNELNDLY